MSDQVTKLPDGSAFFTATVMSKEEALKLPLKERPLNMRISSEIYHAVFEAIGAASLCWDPRPVGNFCSEEASKVAVELCFKIANDNEAMFVEKAQLESAQRQAEEQNRKWVDLYNAEVQARRREKQNRPKIVCICGSSRFVDVMAVKAWELEKQGVLTLAPHLLPQWYEGVKPDHQAEAEGVAHILDILHLRKIDLSDEVLVVNVGGYIGQRTATEIAYAKEHRKPVTYLEGAQ